MSETSAFLSLTVVATVSTSVCILSARSLPTSKVMARSFYIAIATLSFTGLLWILLDEVGMVPLALHSATLLYILIYRLWLAIGTGISSGVLLLADMAMFSKPRIGDAPRSFITSPYVLKGLCLSVSISFIGTEIGKIGHDPEMRQFFVQSGYPVLFLYAIISFETFGAIGLLFSRTRLAASFGLALIMVGAITTHARNRDPFSDSLEALHLLVLLICIVVIRLLSPSSKETAAV